MSTHSITVSGPSAQLAMLRALARKLLDHLDTAWTVVKVTITRASRVAKAAATTGLAVVGSPAGYQLVRHATTASITGISRLFSAGLGLVTRGVRAVGRLALAAIDLLSPATSDLVAELTQAWIIEPVTDVAHRAAGWISDAAQLVWELSDASLVRAVTTRAAQVASVILGVHAITKGAAAAKVVQSLPWTMDAILVLTNPGWAALLVGGAFLAALVVAAFRIAEGPDGDPTKVDGVAAGTEKGADIRPTLTRVENTPAPDVREVAASLSVEVTPDGSVVVDGVPEELPEGIGLQVAHIAAEAATARLERILLHRPVLTRDDRRVLTKVAREAVRVQHRLLAS